MTRTPLKERSLPGYTRKEEIANMTTHIVGAGVGVIVFALSIWIAFVHQNVWSLISGAVYGLSLILLIPGNMLIHSIADSASVTAALPLQAALVLIALATLLTILGGLIPAKSASKCDPVKALRSE